MMKKTLIVYYSFEGSTRLISETIATVLDADLLECKPIKDLKSTGFSKYFWGGRQVMFKKKPDLKEFERNPENYEFIIIGTPVWAYNVTPAIRSFLSQTALSDKKIALFCCHEGNKGKTFDTLKEELQNNNILSEKEFMNVTKDKEENITIAINWSKELHKLIEK